MKVIMNYTSIQELNLTDFYYMKKMVKIRVNESAVDDEGQSQNVLGPKSQQMEHDEKSGTPENETSAAVSVPIVRNNQTRQIL